MWWLRLIVYFCEVSPAHASSKLCEFIFKVAKGGCRNKQTNKDGQIYRPSDPLTTSGSIILGVVGYSVNTEKQVGWGLRCFWATCGFEHITSFLGCSKKQPVFQIIYIQRFRDSSWCWLWYWYWCWYYIIIYVLVSRPFVRPKNPNYI